MYFFPNPNIYSNQKILFELEFIQNHELFVELSVTKNFFKHKEELFKKETQCRKKVIKNYFAHYMKIINLSSNKLKFRAKSRLITGYKKMSKERLSSLLN